LGKVLRDHDSEDGSDWIALVVAAMLAVVVGS
jgi:hypothetical protein